MKNILIVDSGSRGHSLGHALAGADRKLFFAPGNAGTAQLGENISIPPTEVLSLCSFAHQRRIDLTIVGREDSLLAGIVDVFQNVGRRIFGPTRAAAEIEGSKVFSKRLMEEYRIPTARYAVFNDYKMALQNIERTTSPLYIKADGIANGQGAILCTSLEEAQSALYRLMVEKVHGESGTIVLIEECLYGPEISVHAVCDDGNSVIFPFARDYKRALEGDLGDNTGGMGAVAPVNQTDILHSQVRHGVVEKTLEALALADRPFKGLLFPGIKLTPDGPKVLEYNARFGDPETQVFMRLLDSDLLTLLEGSVDNKLSGVEVKWKPGYAVCVVLASKGYPHTYETGFPITGIEEAEKIPGVVVFHAGTAMKNGALVTACGRVLSVTCYADRLETAVAHAYDAARCIQFEGVYYRQDIGKNIM